MLILRRLAAELHLVARSIGRYIDSSALKARVFQDEMSYKSLEDTNGECNLISVFSVNHEKLNDWPLFTGFS